MNNVNKEKHEPGPRPTLYGETLTVATMRVRKDQIAWLDSCAAQLGISKNELIRRIFDAEMKRTEEPDKKTRTP